MKQILLVVVVLALVVSTSVWVFRAELGLFVFKQALDSQMAPDRWASLPEGLHLYVCGAGSPLPDPKRGGSCLGLLAGEQAFVVDAGTGGARTLMRMGFPFSRLQRIFITHYHSDHIDGLGEMLLQSWIGGSRTEPTPVAGPIGVATIVDGFNLAYRLDSQYRLAHHGPEVADLDGAGAEAFEFELGSGASQVYEAENLKITVFKVDHDPVLPSVGYRFDFHDRSIVISGDTNVNWEAAQVAKDADLVVHEALNREMVRAMADAAKRLGRDSNAKILADIQDYHASPVEAAQQAAAANADELLIYHVIPPLLFSFLEAAYVRGADEHFSNKITVAEDGMLISLPLDSDDILHSRGI